jgi:hypothetical protein
VNLKTAAAAAPVIAAAGVVNAASFSPGIQAGSWVAIFGQNLEAAARSLTAADVVNGGLPGAGLYQINVTVPALANGTYPVIAQVVGVTTQAGVFLAVQS